MRKPYADWSQWSKFLRQWGMQGMVAWLLEASGPLTLLGAQALYLSQPFLGSEPVENLAHMLEDHQESQAFAAFLREEIPS